MSIRPFVLGLALAAPLFAQAGYSINNSAFNCSAALSFANSTGLEAHCAGNFSVTGGTWTSDTKIALSADGSLTLDGVAMTAPTIDLMGAEITVNAFLTAEGGTVRIGAPGDVRLNSTTDLNQRLQPVRGTGGALLVSPGAVIDVTAGNSFSGDGNGRDTPVIGGMILVRDDAPLMPPLQLTAGKVFNIDLNQFQLSLAPAVPEPESYALALAALATGAALARRRKA